MTIGVNGNMRFNDCDDANNRNKYTTSFAKHAQDAGMATGFVTNTRITHATVNFKYLCLVNLLKCIKNSQLEFMPTLQVVTGKMITKSLLIVVIQTSLMTLQSNSLKVKSAQN